MYILPPSISKKIEGYRWQSFTPPAAGKSRRFRGLICHRRSQFAAYASGVRLSAALEQGHQTDDRRYNFIIEVLRKIHTIKGLGLETLIVRRYELLQATSAKSSYRSTKAGASARNTGHLFSQLTAVAVGAYGSTLVMDNSLTVGALAACTLLASRSAQPMIRALGTWTQFQNVRAGQARIKEILSTPREVSPEAPSIHVIEGRIQLDRLTYMSTPE